MLPGAVGSRRIPRKIAGIEMITIDPSIVAMVMLRVVLDSATHLYRSPGRAGRAPPGAAGPALPSRCAAGSPTPQNLAELSSEAKYHGRGPGRGEPQPPRAARGAGAPRRPGR